MSNHVRPRPSQLPCSSPGARRRRPRPAVLGALLSTFLSARGGLPADAPMIVCDSSLDRVVRLEDVDGSGLIEPESPGEVVVYYDDASPGPDLSTPSALALGADSAVYLLDGGSLDAILLLRDLDGDGDASDEAEVAVFFDNSSSSPDLATPNSLVVAADGSLLIADDGRSHGVVLAVRDANGDGDALDEGEWTLVYDSELVAEGEPIVLADPESLAVDAQGRIFLADATLQAVFVLEDRNGDGDAMDAGEVREFYDPRGGHAFADPEGLAFGPDGDLYAADEDTGLIVRLRDLDGDGTAMGAGESRIVVDADAPVAPRDTNDIVVSASGALLVLDGSRDQVFRITDLDGDGVAYSEGEVLALIGGDERVVGTPSGIVLLEESEPPGPKFRRGDANGDGERDVSDAVSILGYLFLGRAEPSCLDAADVNDDGEISISDPIALLGYLFLGGEPPAPPYLESGVDPTEDDLGCN